MRQSGACVVRPCAMLRDWQPVGAGRTCQALISMARISHGGCRTLACLYMTPTKLLLLLHPVCWLPAATPDHHIPPPSPPTHVVMVTVTVLPFMAVSCCPLRSSLSTIFWVSTDVLKMSLTCWELPSALRSPPKASTSG